MALLRAKNLNFLASQSLRLFTNDDKATALIIIHIP